MRDIIPPAKRLIEDHNVQSGRDHHVDAEAQSEPVSEESTQNEVFYELPEYNLPQADEEVLSSQFTAQSTQEETNMLGHKEEKAFQSLYQKPIRQTPLEEPKNSKVLSVVVGTLVLLALGAVGLMTFVFNKAEVVLKPKLSETAVSSIVVFTPSDVQEGVKIQLLTDSESDSKAILRRGEKTVESKSEGSIVIYNNYSTAAQKLVKNTRFEGSNGKIYRINDSITIPGMSGTTPGSLEVKVYADSNGSEYNSGPMDFTIPGFKGTPRYSGFYARSKGSLTGGYSGKMSVVAPEDLQNAETELTAALKTKLAAKIKASVPSGYILIEDDISYKSTNNADILASDPNVEFSMQVTAEAYAVQKSSLEQELLSKNGVGDASRRIDNLETLTIQTDKTTNTSGVTLNVKGNALIGSNLNESAIQEALKGVSESEFESVISKFGGVDVAELDISPYWSRSIPTDIQKINITIQK